MDQNSEEELFDDVVTGLKEQGLVSVNVSRKKRSEFVYESQSQESFQKSPSFSESQFYTYEVNKNGEMLLLEKSSKSDRLENVLLEHSQACTPVFSAEKSCQDNGGTDPGSSLTVLNDITPLSFLNQPQIPPSPGHNSENVIESVVEIIPDAESPTILNSYDFEIGTFHVVEETRNDTDSPTILNSYNFNLEPELSTSFVVPTSSRMCDDHNYDPDQTSCSSEDDDSGMNEGNGTGRKTKKRKGLAEAEHWKARMNKRLREQGKDYIGWRRNENSCNTHNAPRAAKTLKETCRDSDQESTANEDSQLSAPDYQSDTSIIEDRPTSGSSTKTSKFPNIKRPRVLGEEGSSASSLLMKYILKEKDEKEAEDDIDNFFYGVAATVKKFNEYNRAMIKSQIFGIVSQMELREINEKGNNYYGSNNYSTAGPSGNYSTAGPSGNYSTTGSSGNYATQEPAGNYSTPEPSTYISTTNYDTERNARQLNTPLLSDTEKDLTNF
ncbi:hypothetical protein PYW08_006308 [Mythimna loreyi]|uniref:Uncharacterized protein n=1 Tax=Mythimna loreyi TaxID=667449 RepID=A0ACC2QSE5_9NEOP|nr:hypothetical protein PYW08_006308 [Mythimna loreyi]